MMREDPLLFTKSVSKGKIIFSPRRNILSIQTAKQILVQLVLFFIYRKFFILKHVLSKAFSII